jgi:putative nucleotidyltransferase with HDIG domain
MSAEGRTPRRFVTRTLIATLATVAFVLTAVLLVVTLTVRDHVRRSVVEKLETGQRLLATLEERRSSDLRAQAATLAESPTLKAALDTYQAERRNASETVRSQLVATVTREIEKLASRLDIDVIAARDVDGRIVAVAGRRAADWISEAQANGSDGPEAEDASFVSLPAGIFRVTTVPLRLQDADLGSLQLAHALDDRYASELSSLSGARAVILSNDRLLATTLAAPTAQALTPGTLDVLDAGGLMTVAGEEYAVRPLLREGSAAVYVLDSIDAAARPLVRSSLEAMALIGLGAFALAGVASLWLARTISRPIDTLSLSLTEMTQTRTFDRPLPPSGTSLEVDSLTGAFNSMMASVQAAEAETTNAYLEAIRALALALDARDPYTAGHSERVSALSVAIGRQMQLDEHTLEVLRLGALLHDIGKIGVRDDVLRKPSKLTAEEYELIKAHPTVGSKILRSVRFLEPHLPMVELHHERPDGGGYPFGLKGDAIPVLARIVHVADAFDAMTSARAYRPAMPADAGLAELRRCAGTEFDPEAVAALEALLGAQSTQRGQSTQRTQAALRAQSTPSTPGVRRPKHEAALDPLDEFASEGPRG